MSRIVVGTDTSAAADLAVEHAATVAGERGAELVVLHVRPEGELRSALDPRLAPDPAQHLRRLSGRFADLVVRTRVERGDPAELIVAVAEEEGAELVVVGNRGTHGAWWRVRDSVPNLVLRHAPCSVLIVDTRRAQ